MRPTRENLILNNNCFHSKSGFQMFSLKSGHPIGVSILSSINLHGTFLQITQAGTVL